MFFFLCRFRLSSIVILVMENSHSMPLNTNESLENNEEKAQEVDTSSSLTVQHVSFMIL